MADIPTTPDVDDRDVPSPLAADARVSDAWFDAAICRNCGAPRDTPYCSACGQKAARRYRWRDIGKEGWLRLRLFEIKSLRTARRLLASPGVVAREFVLGRRTAHMHPLTLLVALVALLAVMLAINQYFATYAFQGRDADVDLMAQRVIAYANWSFSLGIVAVFFASWTVFNGRLGYNMIEQAVLAVCCQNVVLIVILINLLPTLIWRDPAFVLWHKAASQYYIPVIKIGIVALAYRQFFRLELRTDWWRLVLACAIFAALSWLLLRLYATMILWLVTGSI